MIKFFRTDYESDKATYLGAWNAGAVVDDPDGAIEELFENDMVLGGEQYSAEQVLSRFSGPYLYAIRTPDSGRAAGGRVMAATVPENANSISTPDEAPSGTEVIQGPRGGWYYLPTGRADEPGRGRPDDAVEPEVDFGELRAEYESLWPADADDEAGRISVAQAVLERTGVNAVLSVGDREEVLTHAAEVDRLAESGMFEGLTMLTDSKFDFRSGRGKAGDRSTGLYNTDSRRMFVNMDAENENRADGTRNGWYSVDHPLATMWHELGHHTHNMKQRSMDRPFERWNPRDEMLKFALVEFGRFDPEYIEDKGIEGAGDFQTRDAASELQIALRNDVSGYAATSAAEFVAETFTGLMAGETYPEYVMSLYERLRGFEPPQEARLSPTDEATSDESEERDMAEGEDTDEPPELGDLFTGPPEDAPDYIRDEYDYLHENDSEGVFGSPEDRKLASTVPDNARSIPNPSAAPAGTEVVQGPQGGWYAVPVGGGGGPPEEGGSPFPTGDEVEEPADFGPAIEAFGAERVNAYEVGDRLAVDFQLPMPGEEPPQRSSFAFYPDGHVEGTLRLGILDREKLGKHHSLSEEETQRLADAVERADPPEGAPVMVDFGDFHYPPRPHIRFRRPFTGGLFTEEGGQQITVQEGDALTASPGELYAFTQRAAREIYNEFEGDWAEGGTAPPNAAADGESETGESVTEQFAPQPEEDVPAFRESEEMSERVEALHAEPYVNGFTLNSDLTPFEGTGYVATITSDNFTHPDAGGEGVSKDDVVEMYDRMLGVLEEFPGIGKIGTFYGDDGYMSVDLNIVTDDRELAVDIGRANNQQAIWDLNEMAPIDTDGDGESPVDASDPRAVLEFIRDIVQDGREAQALAALTPEESEATVTEYETEDGERVSGLELYGKVKSGVWDITDSDESMFAVVDAEGNEMILTAVGSGRDMADGDYQSCVAETDHEDPEAYCAAKIKDETGEWPDETDAYVQARARGVLRTMAEADTDEFISPFKQVPASDTYTDEERAFHTMYEDVLWDEQANGRELFAGTRMPDNVRERMVDAIQEGALFPEFDALNAKQRTDLREYLLNEARGGGWTVRDLASRLRQIDTTMTQQEAERIARTETQAIVTTAREMWYESEDDFVGEETLFIWQGPQDHRTTEACEWLKEQTNPRYGGEPVTVEEMRELVEEASKRYFPDLDVRRWTVHPYERHTIVRYYG